MSPKKYDLLISQCFFLLPFLLFGQRNAKLNEFSDYNMLENQILRLKKQPDSALFFVKLFIAKAKKENNYQKLFSGYDYAVKNTLGEKQIKYGDSIITTAVKLKDNDQIGEAFISLAQTYIANEQYKDALDQTLTGYDYFKINNNPYLINTAKRSIATIKTYLEDYHDAKKLNTECLAFFREHKEKIKGTDYTLYYLHSLIALINNNTHLRDFKDNPKLLQEGIAFVSDHKDYKDYLPYLISSQGMDAYFRQDYPGAVRYFTRSLSLYTDKWAHLTDKFYLGMSYRQLSQQDKALPLFLEIVKEYDETGRLDPEFRPAFEGLIDYYAAKGDRKQQLFYIDKLIKLDKETKENQSYIASKVKTEYDEASLLQFKKNLERSQLFERIGYGAVAVSISLLLGFVFIRRSRKKQFSADVAKENTLPDEQPRKAVLGNSSPAEIPIDYSLYKPINRETVISLLKKLDDFEAQKGYTKSGLKLYDFAIALGTNERYLSKIISISKGKNFNQYVNDLRLEEFRDLKKNKTEDETIKSLAQKSGFESYSLFFRAYKERYGATPAEEPASKTADL